ncbi:MAG: hypothetical protein LBQ49_00295 [Rickettsiales bacterium]|jgi:hypothetical protein|nr:hypothetical protein [Rickettsiales bacterium]
MKKIFAIACASLVFPLLAEVAPVGYYEDEAVEEVDAEEVVEKEPQKVQAPIGPVNPAASIGRASQSVRGAAASSRQSGTNLPSRAVASSRAAVQQTVRATDARHSDNSRPVSSRTAATQSRAAVQSRAVGRNAGVAPVQAGMTARNDANQQRAVSARAGSLYNPVQARVGISGAATTLTRSSTGLARAGSLATPSLFNSSAETASSGISAEELAAQTDFCKAQYLSCMDNFCNVLDDNQGRCSCSKNIKNYEKTELELKNASISLQEVAVKIQYLGLSADEVKTLFTQTAAEAEMANARDTSDIKNSLDRIQKLLVDPTTATTSSGSILSSTDLFGNLDFGNGFNFSSFMSGNESISNQRGEELFKIAQSRCKSVLTECTGQGVAENLITAHYDLEIDKQCVAYERALTDSNDQMKTTIRNAQTVLQQARLVVAQNKNRYDLKGCINALDVCMQDDFVCGSDYKYCLDPSGEYIVNGDLVIGQEASQSVIDDKNKTCPSNPSTPATATVECGKMDGPEKYLRYFLKEKIGTIDKEGRAIGMCSGIMSQCQNYTFNKKTGLYMDEEYSGTTTNSSSSGNTLGGNRVLSEYLNRTIVNIKAKQSETLLGYAENCRSDVITCLSRNILSTSTSEQSTAIKACTPYLNTCASASNIDFFDEDSDIASAVCKGTVNKVLKKTQAVAPAKSEWKCVAPSAVLPPVPTPDPDTDPDEGDG